MTQKRTIRKYTDEFREEAVALVTQQGYSVTEAAKSLGITIAIALFKQDTTKSASMTRKKKMTGLDDDYRSTLLESGIIMR